MVNSSILFFLGVYAFSQKSGCGAMTYFPLFAGFVGMIYFFYFFLSRQLREKWFCTQQEPEDEEGWQIRESKRYPGRVYYYNSRQNIKSWNRPEAKKYTMTMNPIQEDEELPTGWVRKVSKKHSGHEFYFNPNTGEKTWERPGSSRSSVNSTASLQGSDASRISVAIDTIEEVEGEREKPGGTYM
jgi:hypothetical protein